MLSQIILRVIYILFAAISISVTLYLLLWPSRLESYQVIYLYI